MSKAAVVGTLVLGASHWLGHESRYDPLFGECFVNTRFCLRPYDKVVSEKLEHAGILRPIARALSARGVKSSDDLLEDWTALLPPATLQGTQQAAVLLANAIQSNKRITVVADYDCDGATACAIAVRGLAMMGCQAQFIVPDRFKLGYGLTPAIVDAARSSA